MVRRLLLLNGLAILGVVLFHAAGWGFTALFAWRDRWEAAGVAGFEPMASPEYYALRIVEQLVVVSIPAFLFVSGYFVAVAAGATGTTVGWNFVGSRVRSLAIPYLIWSLALLVLAALGGRIQGPVDYLRILATGGANPAYYYVILLGQLYLVAPILVPLARKRPTLLLSLAGVVQFSIQLLPYPVYLGLDSPELRSLADWVPKWFFPVRIFWFSLGIVAAFHLRQLKEWAGRFRRGLLGVLMAAFVVGIVEWEIYLWLSGLEWLNHRETWIDNVYCAAFLLCFIAFDKISVPFAKGLVYLGTRSFGIYLVHSPVMEYVARGIYHLAPGLLAHQIVLQPILIALGIAVPLVAMAVVERTPARRFYRHLFG
jgi:peptidoglycan/LPS O-acetylase OafA/YrhL